MRNMRRIKESTQLTRGPGWPYEAHLSHNEAVREKRTILDTKAERLHMKRSKTILAFHLIVTWQSFPWNFVRIDKSWRRSCLNVFYFLSCSGHFLQHNTKILYIFFFLVESYLKIIHIKLDLKFKKILFYL